MEVFYLPFTEEHCADKFDCEAPNLNTFIKRDARSDSRRSLNKTFIATPDGTTVIGFVTIATTHVKGEELPPSSVEKKRRDRDYPVLIICKLGVHKENKRQGIGENLVRLAYTHAATVEKLVGCHGVIVDAWESAEFIYDKAGFQNMPGAIYVPRNCKEMGEYKTIQKYIVMSEVHQYLNPPPAVTQ